MFLVFSRSFRLYCTHSRTRYAGHKNTIKK